MLFVLVIGTYFELGNKIHPKKKIWLAALLYIQRSEKTAVWIFWPRYFSSIAIFIFYQLFGFFIRFHKMPENIKVTKFVHFINVTIFKNKQIILNSLKNAFYANPILIQHQKCSWKFSQISPSVFRYFFFLSNSIQILSWIRLLQLC